MSVKRRIKPGDKIRVAFTARERTLVIEHTFAGPEWIDVLEVSRQSRGKYIVGVTLDDLDELLGHIAAEANHTKSKTLRRELDALYARLQDELQAYDDGQWTDPSVTFGLAKKQPGGASRATLSVVKAKERP